MEAVMGLVRELAELLRPSWGPLTATARAEGPVAVATIEELEARQTEIRSRLQEIDSEHAGQALPEDVREEWNNLNEERETNVGLIDELRARHDRIEELATDPARTEDGAGFQTRRPNAVRGDDIYDLSTVRASVSNPEEATRELRDRAHRAVEACTIPHPRADEDTCKAHVERLLQVVDDEAGTLSRRLLATGSPLYRRAFGKAFIGKPLNDSEMRSLSVGTDAAGGFAVPFTLDPTIIPTSNSSVNPYRAVARVETIVVDEWKGVSSAGVTATRRAEEAEAADNAPTLAQPNAIPTRVDVFIPFSIEVGQDWGGLQSEMAVLIQDAKDDEEASSFTTGDGNAPNPQGLITGATTTTAAGGTAAFAVADVYKLEEALPPRFRSRAVALANRFTYNKVRQFDTSGGASLWMQLERGLDNQVPRGGNTGAQLIGYPAYEASAMAAALTTGSKILVLGDFRYFLIVDRIGLSIDLIPHLFGANRRPTGQRGLFAFWRNTSKVLSAAAFRVLVTG